MASEVNHHVGYSRENECWFVRFYPYQTEQHASEAAAAFTRPTPAPCDELKTEKWEAFIAGDWLQISGEHSAWKYSNVRELVTRQNAEEVIAANDKEIASLQQLLEERRNTIASLIPRAPNCGRYLAECNDGQLMYLNHAGKWQECPNFITAKDARIDEYETGLVQMHQEMSALEADNASLIHDLSRIKDHETELVNDNAAKDARIEELERRLKEVELEHTGVRNSYFAERRKVIALEADNKRLREALEAMLVPYEGSDCRHDHHGYCQEHFLEEDCCVAKARAALGEVKP